MSSIDIITTSDGSHSLLNRELNETYHSHHGAVQESLYVFIQHGLQYLMQKKPSSIKIFEVGFGTGLNALLTLKAVHNQPAEVEYTSIEAFPLAKEIWKKLNYPTNHEEAHWFHDLHESPWNDVSRPTSNITLRKLLTTLQQVSLDADFYDLIFYDAFAPNKQPDMWHVELLDKVVKGMKPGGVFVTYCAKGQLKRDLKFLGLEVETLPGPPGKKEMVRGLKK